jgi:hypothetical protein
MKLELRLAEARVIDVFFPVHIDHAGESLGGSGSRGPDKCRDTAWSAFSTWR